MNAVIRWYYEYDFNVPCADLSGRDGIYYAEARYRRPSVGELVVLIDSDGDSAVCRDGTIVNVEAADDGWGIYVRPDGGFYERRK